MEHNMTINKNKTPFADPQQSLTDHDRNQSSMHNRHGTQILDSLKNHFLIAMPAVTDSYFKQSVVYLCEHDDQGAMGFIINYPIQLTVQELLKNAESIDHEPNPPLIESVFLGGPLEMDRGFVLHSPMNNNEQSTALNTQLMMSNSNKILSCLGTVDAPENYMVTLGYASWEKGQLEEEMNKNHWLTIECDNDILFSTPIDQRWHVSLQRLGVTPSQLSSDIGHA